MTESNDNKSVSLYLALFLISMASLTSEILLIRITSLVFFFIIGYAVIGIALLGFGAAGSFLSVYPALLEGNYRRRLTILAAAFSVFTPIAYFISVTPAPYATGFKFLFYLLVISIVMTLHFFLAGLVISYVFTRRVWEIHRLYFINLVGSGIGCFVLIQLIRPLGGEGLILLVTSLGLLSVVFFAYEQSKRTSMAALLLACCVLLLIPYARGIFRIHPTMPGKQMTVLMKHHPDAEIEFQVWDPVARVDAISMPDQYLYIPDKIPFKFATNDGSAGTFILGFEKDFPDVDFTDSTWLGVPYWLKKNPEVLIVGLGGGIDVQAALHYKASKIYGVEISARMIEMMRDFYKTFANSPYQRSNVQIIHDEGRSYIRRMQGKVDLIQMSGVDTFAGQYGGSAIMVENFLYTVESFKEYFEHLKDDGLFCIHRLTDAVFLKSALRTSSLGVEALRQMGAENPEKHFVVISQGTMLTTLMKKTEFTPEEIQTIEESLEKFRLDGTRDPAPFLKDITDAGLMQGRQLLWKPGSTDENKYVEYFRAVQNEDEESFFEKIRLMSPHARTTSPSSSCSNVGTGFSKMGWGL
jgi:spermidine synthase